jgi:hypothetical protein
VPRAHQRVDDHEKLAGVLLTRAFEFVRYVQARLTEAELREAVRQPTEFDALMKNTELAELRVADLAPLLAAKARGAKIRLELQKQAGGFLTTEALTRLLNVTEAAISKQVDAAKLLVIKKSRANLFPRVQFNEDGQPLQGLKQVLPLLKKAGADGWGQLLFLLNPNDRLDGRRPIDVLRAGEVASVVEAAHRYGEHRAD